MKQNVKVALVKSGVGTLCLIMNVLCGMFLYDRNAIVYYSAFCFFSIIAVVYCIVEPERFPHVSRTLLVAAVASAAIVGAYILFYTTGLDKKFNDFDSLKAFIVDSGYWGFAVFIGLTVFQVVALPLPAALTIVLGVAIYGPTVSFVLSTIGTIIGSIISFMLGKVFGRRLCNWMFGAEQTEKYAKLLNEKGRFLFIIMLLFPAFPDDMLCMVAGITDMSYLYFTVVCTLTRPVMIGLTAYLGSGVIPFEGWGIPVWIALGCLLVAAFIMLTGVKARIENRRKVRK